MTFSGKSTQYDITVADGQIIVTDSVGGRDGKNALISVEKLQFTDKTIIPNSSPKTPNAVNQFGILKELNNTTVEMDGRGRNCSISHTGKIA